MLINCKIIHWDGLFLPHVRVSKDLSPELPHRFSVFFAYVKKSSGKTAQKLRPSKRPCQMAKSWELWACWYRIVYLSVPCAQKLILRKISSRVVCLNWRIKLPSVCNSLTLPACQQLQELTLQLSKHSGGCPESFACCDVCIVENCVSWNSRSR